MVKMAALIDRDLSSSDMSDEEKREENEHLKPKVDRYNWLSKHPKYVEMKSWKLKNDQQIFITLIVYLNLCEAKDWWKVDIHPCRDLHLAFITGKSKRKEAPRVMLPIATDTQLSPKRLQEFLQYVRLPELTSTTIKSPDETGTTHREELATPNSLTLAITEPGSTIVYYQISDGLVPPSDPPKDDDEEDEPRKHSTKHQRKRRKKGGPSGVQETVTEYANEERTDYQDDFMEEEL